MIFVFGSNLAGRHGKGAAKYALKNKGAIYGKGEGLQGMSYALPTKDENLKTLPLYKIREHYRRLCLVASARPALQFELTPFGCGLAGYNAVDIKNMIEEEGIEDNMYLCPSWLEYIK